MQKLGHVGLSTHAEGLHGDASYVQVRKRNRMFTEANLPYTKMVTVLLAPWLVKIQPLTFNSSQIHSSMLTCLLVMLCWNLYRFRQCFIKRLG